MYKIYYNPSNNKLHYKLLTPKTESSVRTITIDTLLIELLIMHKNEQELIAKSNSHFYVNNDFIFTPNEGYPKTIKSIATWLDRILKKHLSKKILHHTHSDTPIHHF